MMRMTNERMTNDETGFGLRPSRRSRVKAGHFSVVRRSPFVIFLLAVTFALTACNSSKTLTKANVNQVAEGMAKKQVESILGPPTTIDTKDFVLLKKTVYIYSQGKESVTVVFKDDKVQSTTSTLSE
jgi:outer membrane protein assembly factor BamE (lipoprotein component of BamABCDE complex)